MIESGKGHLSVDEMREHLRTLSKEDHARLKKASIYLTGDPATGLELINRAVLVALNGTRKCPRELHIVVFLIGAMKSILWWERRQEQRAPRHEPVDTIGVEGTTLELVSTARNPEELMLAREEVRARLAILEELFAEDDEAQGVFLGDFDGLSADQIREELNMDTKRYATVRRRIRRTIDNADLKGWGL